MKIFTKLAVILVVLLNLQFANAQNADFKGFELTGKNPETIQLNQTFTKNTEVSPFDGQVSAIYGLAVKADISFSEEKGLVRIILVDQQSDEYLVYEAYPLLEEKTSFSIDNLCEETGALNNLKPQSLRIEVNGASLSIKSITYTTAADQNVDILKVGKEKKNLQNNRKINQINKSIAAKKLAWVAGETEVSALSYSEKKKLYGQSTLPSGIEYYVGGILQAGDGLTLKSATATTMVENWDWRQRHSKNWVTSVKNQGGCGSCWAFATTAEVEAQVNLFFNQPLNLDLSEQDLVSCSGAGDCSGGVIGDALNYISSVGIVDESAFTYSGSNRTCADKNSNPSQIIKIGGTVNITLSTRTEDNIKKMTINYGPLALGITDWSHAMALVGWQVVKAGDKFYIRDLNKSTYWITIPAGSPLIGSTVWIFKNSWGSSWGDAGYVYVQTTLNNINTVVGIKNSVQSLKQNYTVQCVDNDHDGYYWWGLGAKPANCPPCPTEPDGDDSNAALGPLDSYGNCTLLAAAAPVADFTSNITTITANGSINFTDLSTNSPTTWSWSFPGGIPATSTAKNPVVSYTNAGTFDVTLVATNSTDASTKIKTEYVTVSAPIPTPMADFLANITTLTTNGSVNFSDLSTNTPTTWLWTFTGGTPASSTLQNPVVSYSTAGIYSVTLKATNASGDGTITKTNYITVSSPQLPVADFTADRTTLNENGNVKFTDLSVNASVWACTFDGGTPATSTAVNPVVAYKTAGKYNVTLLVTNANGNNTKIKTGYVTVNAYVPTYTYSSSNGNASKEWISQVSMNGSTFTSNSSGSAGYADLTANIFNVAANSAYSMSLTPKYSGKNNYWCWSVWIDLNHDFDFNDAGEQVLITGKSKTAVTKSITIPSTALTGTTRMRVSMKRDALPLSNEVFAYGEVKDFTVNISAPLAASNQLKSANFEDPSVTPGLSLTVFPNPTERVVNLKLDEIFGNEVYSIYNMQGAVVKIEQIESTITPVDVTNLPAGIYVVKVKNGEQIFQEKFIKR